jgi:hypothetical protein
MDTTERIALTCIFLVLAGMVVLSIMAWLH